MSKSLEIRNARNTKLSVQGLEELTVVNKDMVTAQSVGNALNTLLSFDTGVNANSSLSPSGLGRKGVVISGVDNNTNPTALNTLKIDVGGNLSSIVTGNDGDDGAGVSRVLKTETNGVLITTSDKTLDTNLIFNGGVWNAGYAHLIDLNGYRAIRIWGDTTGVLDIIATNALNIGNASFWDSFDATSIGTFNFYYQDPPRYLKFVNNTGVDISVVNLQFGRFK